LAICFEVIMTQTTHPSKETVRQYLDHRMHQRMDPPPTPEEIRQQLGWHLIPENRQPDRDDHE
jgi:hypothetical protein